MELGERGPEAGFALIAVLWFLVLAAAVVAPFAVAARTELLISSNTRQQERLDMLADGLSTLLSLKLAEPNGNAVLLAQVPSNSTPVFCTVGDYTLGVRLQDQSGLIDLNAADNALLAIGARSLGIAPREADAVAAAIVDFRSYNPQVSSASAAISVIGGPKRGPFESVVELSDFKPFKDFEPADFHRVFTVHSIQGVVSMTKAPAELAAMLKATAAHLEAEASGRPPVFAVEVSVQDRTSINGYSGFLVEPAGAPRPPYKRVEQLFEHGIGADEALSRSQCPELLQADFVALLAVDLQ
jgi:general secretion pathway protein K